MKNVLTALLLAAAVLSCSPPSPVPGTSQDVQVHVSLGAGPEGRALSLGINGITLTATRSGFTAVEVDMVYSSTSRLWTGTLPGLAAGRWDISAEATVGSLDDISYAGYGWIDVTAGMEPLWLDMVANAGMVRFNMTWPESGVSSIKGTLKRDGFADSTEIFSVDSTWTEGWVEYYLLAGDWEVTVEAYTLADGAGEMRFSATDFFTVDRNRKKPVTMDLMAGDTQPPSDVSSPGAVPGDSQVILSWTDPSDADFTEVEITWTPDDPAVPVVVEKGVQTATITGLSNGTTYTFTLRTEDSAGNTSQGMAVYGTPQIPSSASTGAEVFDRLIEGVNNEISFEDESTVTVVWDVKTEGTYNFILKDSSVLADPSTALPGLLDVRVTAREGGSVAVPWLTAVGGDTLDNGHFQGILLPGRYLVEISTADSMNKTGFVHVFWELDPGI